MKALQAGQYNPNACPLKQQAREKSTSRGIIPCFSEAIMNHDEDGADIDAVAFYETLPGSNEGDGEFKSLQEH